MSQQDKVIFIAKQERVIPIEQKGRQKGVKKEMHEGRECIFLPGSYREKMRLAFTCGQVTRGVTSIHSTLNAKAFQYTSNIVRTRFTIWVWRDGWSDA